MKLKKIIIGILVLFVLTVVGIKYFSVLYPIGINDAILYPSFKPKPTLVKIEIKKSVLLDVPFVAQAPTGKWSDPREQDGCEEATSYMAYFWATGKIPSKDLAEQEQSLLAISDWEEETYGSYHDTQASDTVARIINGYYKYEKAKVIENITLDDIKRTLSNGMLVIIPADGRKLHNPFYTNGGPERHNLVIKGYDEVTDEFITNDNGTRHGESYRYKQEVLFDAIRDYSTGDHLPIIGIKKVMIVVEK